MVSTSRGQARTHRPQAMHFEAVGICGCLTMSPLGQASRHRPQPMQSFLLIIYTPLGERVMAQALVQAPAGAAEVTFELSALQGRSGIISADCAETGFVTAVWTDGLNPDGTGCGVRTDRSQFDSSRVADRIDIHTRAVALAAGTQQGFWLSLDIPRDAAPGRYRGTLRFFEAGKPFATLPLQLERLERDTLPSDQAAQLSLFDPVGEAV